MPSKSIVTLRHQEPALAVPNERYTIRLTVYATSLGFQKNHRNQIALGDRNSETLFEAMRHDGFDLT